MRTFIKAPLLIAFAVSSILIVSKILIDFFGPIFLINFTESVPKGIYSLSRIITVERGMYVALRPPENAIAIASGRPWFRQDRLFIKQIGGVEGDRICILTGRLTINGTDRGPVYEADRQGLPLPHFSGCYDVPARRVFLIGPESPWTFDSRYFGTVLAVRLQSAKLVIIHCLPGSAMEDGSGLRATDGR